MMIGRDRKMFRWILKTVKTQEKEEWEVGFRMTLKPSSCSVRYDSVMYVCVQDENTYTTEFIHKDT